MPTNYPIQRRQAFQPTCPQGGKYYACPDSKFRFVGCCKADACLNGCSAGNLALLSFDASFKGKVQDQQCSSGSQWYTCLNSSPPFMGCCKSNPCNNGCPATDLTAGSLDSRSEIAADFLPARASSTMTQSSSSVSQTSTPTTAASNAPATKHVTETKHVSAGTITGAAVGGFVAIGLFVLLLVFLFRRKAKKSCQNAIQPSNFTSNPPVNQDSKVQPVGFVEAPTPDLKQKDLFLVPELQSTPAPSYTSILAPVSELDGASSMQRAVAISRNPSPQSSNTFDTPSHSHPSPISLQTPSPATKPTSTSDSMSPGHLSPQAAQAFETPNYSNNQKTLAIPSPQPSSSSTTSRATPQSSPYLSPNTAHAKSFSRPQPPHSHDPQPPILHSQSSDSQIQALPHPRTLKPRPQGLGLAFAQQPPPETVRAYRSPQPSYMSAEERWRREGGREG